MTKTFYYTDSLLIKNSTKQLEIYNQDNKKTGYIQRVFTNKLEYIVDLMFHNWFLHITTTDVEGNKQAEAKSILLTNRSKWNVPYQTDKGAIKHYEKIFQLETVKKGVRVLWHCIRIGFCCF